MAACPLLPEEQWEVYRTAMRAARKRGVRFGLGGAFGCAFYTGQWRNTKDIDLYVMPRDREAMIAALGDAGLQDYYAHRPYDRGWIYRSHRGEIIVDVIWAMANQRATVDEAWFAGGRRTSMCGEVVDVIAAEEIIWQKLYIIQRERCDWPDVLNLFYYAGGELDWQRLLERLGEDWALLAGAVTIFGWLSPGRARRLPSWLWERLRLTAPEGPEPQVDPVRVALVDSRPWFQAEPDSG